MALVCSALCLLAVVAVTLTPLKQWVFGDGAPPRDEPYYVDVDDSEGLSEQLVIEIARDVCSQALDLGDCGDYAVEVTDLGGVNGLVEVTWVRPGPGVTDSDVALNVSMVQLDRSLLDQSAQFVANVAAHEWNHVEQVLLVQSLEGRKKLIERAYDYYRDRVPGGVLREDAGLEVLTDCMATVGDNVPVSREQPSLAPYYLRTVMGATDPVEACGDWYGVLHGGE